MRSAAMAGLVFAGLGASAAWSGEAKGRDAMAEILGRIVPPRFPERNFPVDKFGAHPGGQFDCTAAIARAMAACHEAGGGHVVIPAGIWLTGAVHLLGGVDLHVAEGATLKFDPDPKKYLPLVATRNNGMDLMNYSALIHADGQDNLGITGTGTLDGQASYDTWWSWSKNKTKPTAGGEKKSAAAMQRLLGMVERDVPLAERIFGEGSFLRPNFVTLVRCRNILIEGVHIRNSPMWELHPLLSSNITVRHVDISSHGPNNDGCDPESCRDMLIEDCIFDTGDDCIAIKSGRNDDGRRAGLPAENIIVRRCTMKDGHGGVTLGSECSADIRNIFVEDCVMDSPDLNRVLRIKSNAMRGGTIENVFVSRVKVGRVSSEIVEIDFRYDEGAHGPHVPIVRNVNLDHIASKSSPRVLSLRGLAAAPIGEIRLTDCNFQGVEGEDEIEFAAPAVRERVTVQRAGP